MPPSPWDLFQRTRHVSDEITYHSYKYPPLAIIRSFWSKSSKNKSKALDVEMYKKGELNTMLQWSQLIYSYSDLRDIVRENDANRSENQGKEGKVAFEQPELILTQQYHGGNESPYEGTFLKFPIAAVDIVTFIKLNKKYLVGKDGKLGFNPKGDVDVKLPTVKRLEQVDDFDAEIIEFDDKSSGTGFMASLFNTELVYSIVVNRTEKRLTLVFRGSANTKDWIVDASGLKKTPSEVKEFAGGSVNVHMGFSNYLFGGVSDGRYDKIINLLKQVYDQDEFKDYELFITGHSLGGGLSQLLGFTLAGSPSADFIPKPVKCITYASPTVGNKHFYNHFQKLEKENKLRHIRVSNEGDVVPTIPSIGYYQTGINLHVDDNKRVQINHKHAKKSFFSQVGISSGSKHSLTSYEGRLFTEDNEDIVGMDTDELYEKYSDF